MNEAFEQAMGLSLNATDFGSLPDRLVLVTATCSLFHCPTFELAVRPFLRLQRRNWSDPKLHRANSEAQSECEWKQGRRVAIPNNGSKQVENSTVIRMHEKYMRSTPQTGPPFSAVNG